MTLLDRLQAHRGGLIQIKTQLYWYGGRGWDGFPGRICLILDVAAAWPGEAASDDAEAFHVAIGTNAVAALLLVDGAPRWVWVAEADIELLT